KARPDSEGRDNESSSKYGMSVEPLTPEIARELQLNRDAKGVVIADVDPSGAADSARLRAGDLMQAVKGKSWHTAEEVRSALNATGDKPAVLLIARGNNTIFVPL